MRQLLALEALPRCDGPRGSRALTLHLAGVTLGALLAACQAPPTPGLPDASGPFVGDVTLLWAPTSDGVTANFTTPQSPTAPGAPCPGTQLGTCCVYGQPAIDLATGGAEPLTLSAGPISVADGTQLLGTFDFKGSGYLPLSSAETPALAWSPGDTLAVSAPGATVDSFFATVVAPPAFAGVSPALTPEAQIVVHLAQDFTVSWTPPAGAVGEVTLEVFDPAGFYLDCTGPDVAGTLTAPAATFAGFLKGDTGYVTLIRAATAQATSADATVTVQAQTTDVGLATFQ